MIPNVFAAISKDFLERLTPIQTTARISGHIIRSIAAVLLLLCAQVSLAGSATWLSSPQNSAWENANNWTPGGPPNGPSDIATFAQSSQGDVNISTSEEVNSIVFTSNSAPYVFSIGACNGPSCGGQLIISGTGVDINSSVEQNFQVANSGQIIFYNASTAASAHMSIVNGGRLPPEVSTGDTIFNDTSSAGGASIVNASAELEFYGGIGQTIFNGASTADHATITNQAGDFAGETIFMGSSTADSATLIANEGSYNATCAIFFNDASTGGTARVKVFGNGYLDISGHQGGLSIGSIEGSGNVLLGANNLRVGTNGLNTSFSGVISNDGQGGSLMKVGSGILTFETNDCIAGTVGLVLVSGSIIKLDFTGPPDVIASLKVNGVPQPPGVYGGEMSGAPHILPEFDGLGTMEAGPISTLANISTRAFVQTGDNVVIGGFIVQGTEEKRIVIRAIGPELTQYGVPNALANPTLELYDSTGALIAFNNNWVATIIGGIITSDQVAAIRASGYAPGDPSESAMIVNVPPGNYTAIVRGVANTTGVALAEVYDLSPAPNSTLGNISTRSFVRTGDNVMIGGVIVQGTLPRRVIVRAIGPELAQYGVPDVLADPTLELHDATGALIASNDNWQHTIIGGIITASQVHDIVNSGHAPRDPRESAIIATLPPGNYTAIVRGVNNTTGVGLVEVYD